MATRSDEVNFAFCALPRVDSVIWCRLKVVIVLHFRIVIAALKARVSISWQENEFIEIYCIETISIRGMDALRKRLAHLRAFADLVCIVVNKPVSFNLGRQFLLSRKQTDPIIVSLIAESLDMKHPFVPKGFRDTASSISRFIVNDASLNALLVKMP